MEFNEQQLKAINTIDGSVQVIASAGSGKTSTLVERIANMVNNGIPQSEILTISFTNASAKELEEKLKVKGINEVTSGTFHSVCKQIIEENTYKDIANNFPNKYKYKRTVETITGEKNINLNDILAWISYQYSYNLNSASDKFEEKESVYDETQLRTFFSIYEDFKNDTDTYDFDDWLTITHDLYKKNKNIRKWSYVLIDENQDSNLIQHLLINDFCSTDNIFVVGDYNQCIYCWNGATPELFKDFDKTHKGTKVINLNTNYRSCANIVEAANNFIEPYNEGYVNYKNSIPNNKENGIIECKKYADKTDEALNVVNKIKELIKNGTNQNDIAVIYRNNCTSDYVENELKKNEIPYTIYNNGSFFDRKEIKGILSILRLVNSTTDDEAMEILLTETRFYPFTYFKGTLADELKMESGKKNITIYEAFMDHAWEKSWQRKNADAFVDFINRLKIQNEKHLSIGKMIDNIVKMFRIEEWIFNNTEASSIDDKLDGIENLKTISSNYSVENFVKFCTSGININKNKDKDGVSLMTIHKSKGLEFKVVFLIGLEDGKFPSSKSSVESEARLMYVAVTRPKEQLYVSSIDSSLFYEEYSKK